MRKSPFLACLALSLAAPNAFAQGTDGEHSWYLQFNLGAAQGASITAKGRDFDFDPGLAAAVAIGRPLFTSESFDASLEFEASYITFTVSEADLAQGETGQVRAVSYLAGLVGDIHLTSETSWYIGAAVGFMPDVHYDTFVVEDNDGLMAQFKTGLLLDLGGNSAVSFGYRFQSSEDITILGSTSTESINVEAHVLELGYRWGI